MKLKIDMDLDINQSIEINREMYFQEDLWDEISLNLA